MGFRFSLAHANWLAHVLQPVGATPKLESNFEQEFTLKNFLESMDSEFLAHPIHRRQLHGAAREALDELRNHTHRLRDGRVLSRVLAPIREYFRHAPWIAMLIPSGEDWRFDEFFSSRNLIQQLVMIRNDDPGLILQVQEVPRDGMPLNLDHIFPSFKVAVANATRWPGVLVWTPSGDAAFFEVPREQDGAVERLEWLFSHLATSFGNPPLALIHRQYQDEHARGRHQDKRALNILHISDLHLGSKVAQRRISRVKQLIKMTVEDLGDDAIIAPVVTGDLMNSPNERHLNAVRDFVEFLHDLGTHDPVIVLGNHDVRKDGWLLPAFEQALRLETDRVVWFDESAVGLACFNSVRGGNLARGLIGETEFVDVGTALDREPQKAQSYALLALLHHHPVPVERPNWYRSPWFEKLLGDRFEKTEALEDAELFLHWVNTRRVSGVLHGHKHIPRVVMHEDVPIIGCGSSVGKVDTADGITTYLSMNIVTVDTSRQRISCRLRAERIPGGGFGADENHETVMKCGLR